jgi:hypothetical protein
VLSAMSEDDERRRLDTFKLRGAGWCIEAVEDENISRPDCIVSLVDFGV